MDRAENNDVYNLIMHYRVDVTQAPLHKKTRPTKKKKKKRSELLNSHSVSQPAAEGKKSLVGQSASLSIN